MDINSENYDFEKVLMGYSAGKSLLYRDKNSNETSDGLKSIDVIKSVCKQIKAINNEETQKKSSDSKLKAFKKSNFVPVNMLSIEPQQKPGTSNYFETQYEFDTELLTVIKDAEAIKDTRTGVTQEFDTSFGQIVTSNTTQDNKFTNINCETSEYLTAESSKISSSCQDLKQNLPAKSKCNKKMVNDNNYLSDDSKKSLRNYISNEKELHRNKSVDELEVCVVQNFNTEESEESSLSPILNSKKYKKTTERSSITCMLESFEMFEAIAAPLVQENSNQKVVKEIINSRISNKTSFLPDRNEDFINKNVEHLQFESEKQAISDELHEGILFSSDEESDYMLNQIKDLPLTCALQTSFYKQQDFLDKTMYVGFQTASNRSIQVLTDSFSKAKNIFNNLHNGSKNSSTSFTVSELVQEYDSFLKQTEGVTENVKQNMNLFSQEEEKEVNKLKKDKKVTANEIQAGYKSANCTLLNISDKPCLTNKVDNWKEDIYEHADKVEANIWTKLDGTHFNVTQEHINQNVRTVPDVASNSNINNTQAEINIDDCLMREFEDSLLCINDNKLHTNSESPHPSNTKSSNFSELINIHRSYLNPVCGFKTASKKPIKISHKGITKMKNIFDDIDLNFVNNLVETKIIVDENNFPYNLDKAGTQKDLFDNKNSHKDVEDKVECPQIFTKDISHSDRKFIKEDATASNNPVKFPDEVLVKSKQKDENDNCKEKGANNCLRGLILFQGLRTASNKAVVNSDKALVESNKILQEFDCKNNLIDYDMKNAKCNKQFSKDITHYDNRLLKEYKTAINNDENISEEVLLKPKKELNFDKLNKTEIDGNCREKEVNNFIKESTLFQGFRSASNKPIMISEKALAKSNEMLQDFDYQSNHKDDDMDKATSHKQLTKSITHYDHDSVKKNTAASNNPVNFRYKASTKSKRLLDFDELLDNNIDDNCKEKDENHFIKELTLFQGFRTASNKPVIISEKALEKSNKMLQEIDYQSIHKGDDMDKETYRKQFATNITNYDSKLVKENTTDANNPVNFPGEVSAKSRVLDFDERFVNDIDDICKEKEVNNFIKDSTLFQGFRTASNKPVIISEKSLGKSNKMLQEFDYQSNHKADYIDKTTCHKQLTKSITHYESKIIEENTTASKNPVNFLDEPSVKSKRVLEFDERLNNNIDVNCKEREVNNLIKDSTLLQGFRTASNKPVIISKKALAKSNKMFQEFYFQNIHKDDDMIKEICCEQFTKNIMHHDGKLVKENSTAVNNPVNFPDEALVKSQRVLDFNELLGKNMDDNCKEKEVNNFIKDSTQTLFQGFRTASNKPVIISEKALVKSNKMLQEFDYQSNHKGDDMNKVTCSKQLTTDTAHLESNLANDCTTVFNNQVNIPYATLAKSKRISDFDKYLDNNTEEDLKKEDNNNKREATSFGKGFLAPSNKRVKISNVLSPQSEVSQRHVPLQGYDNLSTSEKSNHLEMFDLLPPKQVFEGFKTANNNQVKVSEEAIARSKKMFEDTNNYSDNHLFKNTNHNVMSFQTGNSKVARVSEEALQESKKIFQDIDDYLKTGIKQKLKNDNKHRKDTAFKTPINNNYKIQDISEARTIFTNTHTHNETVRSKNLINTDNDNIMNTEIISDFEETMYTEDFLNKSPIAKRSGSPILSCPKAKRIKIRPTTNKEIVSDQNITKTDQYAFNTNYKKIKKYKLLDIHALEKKSRQIESSQGIHFDIDNILNFEFFDTRNGISNDRWTIEDVKKYFLDSVNMKIIPEGWVENHIKLILLKLISYEKRFPNVMARVCSVNNIMDQLKYRYERELYNVERPALRKILEKDEVPCRRIVLNVLNIYIGGISITKTSINLSENVELLLSDGWYCIKATIDKMLMKLVKEGKIVVGTKLITQGAELLNCEQGIAPWENTSLIRLKIFGNSTRRAHWTARLGFHDNSVPFVSYLTSVKPEGGKISQLRVVVTRVYPMLYVEKFDDGSTVTRSERLENLRQTKYETEQETLLEKVYEEVEKEFTNQDSQDDESMDIDAKNSESGSQIYQLMKKSRDPSEFRAHLSNSQVKLLQEYTIKRRELSLHELQAKVQELLKKRGLNVVRNVAPMLKIRVADVYRNNVTKAMITVWRPNESLLNILREGSWVDIFNVIPTAVRYSEIQISAGKQSVFRKTVKVQNQMTNVSNSLQRRCFKIFELTNNPYLTTDYNEVDTVGFVFDIKPSYKDFDNKNNHFQNVFLADVNKKIICIIFWGGLKKFGFENILEIGQIVACVNLQKRLGNTRKNIPQYRATEFSYFTKTPKLETSRQLFDDLSKQFLSLDRRKFIQDCNILRNNFDNIKHGNIENISPYRFNNSDYNISKNKAFINSPVGDTNLNINWADFESSFKQTDTVLSPKTLLRKKEVSEKIARLKKYGEPPPLSSIHIVNKTKDAAKPYKSPLVSKNEPNATKLSNSKVNNTVETKLISNIETSPSDTNLNASSDVTNNRCTSPVLPYRGTVNPVKLNFSKKDMTKDDPFSEEFESSPPLSLD